MEKFFQLKWFRNISIAKKLYFVVGVMAILIAVELGTLYFAVNTLSSVRAFVGGEGLWSKSQKDAIYYLRKYHRTHNEEDYQAFYTFLKVPLGDHKTLLQLLKKNPDLELARQGFIEGQNHPDDVDGMINLFRRFHSISYIHKAIGIWIKADSSVFTLIPIAEQLHSEINLPSPSQQKLDKVVNAIDPINQKLRKLEDDFSFTLGEGSRWLENLILKLLFAVALTVEVSGLLLTISVSRGITKGLNEVNRVATKIAKGDFNERMPVYSEDEIGLAATSINLMTDQLIHANKEVEQFAYIASHDLQEPLRTISNYVGLFQEQYLGKLDKDSDEYLEFISGATGRMRTLILDLLDYSKIGHDKIMTIVDCNKILHDVIRDMEMSINENNAKILTESLPIINGYPNEIKSLFQNLIGNAIKFRKSDGKSIINISAEDKTTEWIFAVQDNGIGIGKAYQERIFIIFQRLHNEKKYAGTGIGLAHCKKIIELHNGKIWVESETGKGSTFYFTIPKTV